MRKFAERKIRHRSADMDRPARPDAALCGAVFATGFMAVEIPACTGRTFFDAVADSGAVAGG